MARSAVEATHFSEEIQAANILAITKGFGKILEGGHLDNEFASTPITLTTGTVRAFYSTIYYPEYPLFRTIVTQVIDVNKLVTIADRKYHFYPQDEIQKISSVSFTDKDYQSLGIGSGLFWITKDIIEDALQRFNDFRESGMPVIHRIVDNAMPSEKINGEEIRVQRQGWTSSFAKKLGYALEDAEKKIWVKQYDRLQYKVAA